MIINNTIKELLKELDCEIISNNNKVFKFMVNLGNDYTTMITLYKCDLKNMSDCGKKEMIKLLVDNARLHKKIYEETID